MRLRLALGILLTLVVLAFCGLVTVAGRTPYRRDLPPKAGLCPGCGEKLELQIWDGFGAEYLTDEFQGTSVRHCELCIPWYSLWVLNGWVCYRCGRTWPVSPEILERREIRKPSAAERALSWLELWPTSTRRSYAIVVACSMIFFILGAVSAYPRGGAPAPLRRRSDPITGAQVGFVAMVTAMPLVFVVLRISDPYDYGPHWPRPDLKLIEILEIGVLATSLALLAVRVAAVSTDVAERRLSLGVMAGFATVAARLCGSVVAGLAMEYLFERSRLETLIFPAILSLYAFGLAWVWKRIHPERRRVIGWSGAAVCVLLAWVSIRWILSRWP